MLEQKRFIHTFIMKQYQCNLLAEKQTQTVRWLERPGWRCSSSRRTRGWSRPGSCPCPWRTSDRWTDRARGWLVWTLETSDSWTPAAGEKMLILEHYKDIAQGLCLVYLCTITFMYLIFFICPIDHKHLAPKIYFNTSISYKTEIQEAEGELHIFSW